MDLAFFERLILLRPPEKEISRFILGDGKGFRLVFFFQAACRREVLAERWQFDPFCKEFVRDSADPRWKHRNLSRESAITINQIIKFHLECPEDCRWTISSLL